MELAEQSADVISSLISRCVLIQRLGFDFTASVWLQTLIKTHRFANPSVFCSTTRSFRGNWWGHSPYKHGTPCSACPPSYGGGCKDNLCYKGTLFKQSGKKFEKNVAIFFAYCGCFCLILLEDDSSNPRREETEENNFIEPEAPRSPQKPWSRAPKPEPDSAPTPPPSKAPTATEELQKNEVVNTQQMCKLPLTELFILDLVSP